MSAGVGARPGRLGVGVVGAGRVGAVLGSALRAAGHAVVGASGVSAASRERIDTLLPGVPLLEVPDVVERAELVVLAVPDDALAAVVEGLATTGAWQPGQIVLHTSGRYGASVLDPARQRGAIPLAVHPAMTFTGTSLDLARLEGTTFAVTAPGPVLPIGQALVVEIGGEPVVVDEAARGLYHAGLAHGANHLVVLVAQAAQALAAAGVERPGRVLEPLLGAALDGALRAADSGTAAPLEPLEPLTDAEVDLTDDLPAARDGSPGAIAALTGPVARGDVGTVVEHLRVLEELATTQGATDVPASYRELARAATRRTLATARIDRHQAQGLLDALEEDE
ncbi:Predicted oxidoreductase, contains short-chain dehydrogenase (SDR) and DUF2520 domains [Paraoerskovia marina]|uniref:Predicted oxidoreductase, contains short-chain dehydrogenase (SDR) and DUF2520 domains n=1 Tax=Paraoerskovia marina TaxID=545619 RepID=A0A1H1PXW2_9CELL|nr:DUF2520 domain-containing protein [Paraoerskovia marina]SDS16052.1 Predicted oxidoreductase, contains short-chain dehydrogenase (SDR) and DUF2520 domains [Paraoerskovia marina]